MAQIKFKLWWKHYTDLFSHVQSEKFTVADVTDERGLISSMSKYAIPI